MLNRMILETLTTDQNFSTERRQPQTSPQELLGLYQRIWRSREGFELIFRDLENDSINPEGITCGQLIFFMRSNGYIIPLDENDTRFQRTNRPMPKANSHRDIESILNGHFLPSHKQKRTRKQKRVARARHRITH